MQLNLAISSAWHRSLLGAARKARGRRQSWRPSLAARRPQRRQQHARCRLTHPRLHRPQAPRHHEQRRALHRHTDLHKQPTLVWKSDTGAQEDTEAAVHVSSLPVNKKVSYKLLV